MPIFNNNAEGLIYDTDVVLVNNSTTPIDGYSLVATSPTTAMWKKVVSTTVLQTLSVSVTSDISSSSTSFVDMPFMSIAVTTGANMLVCWFQGAIIAGTSGAIIDFNLLLDGVNKGGASSKPGGSSGASYPLNGKFTVTPGVHTVKIQWRVSGSSVICNAVSQSSTQSATLILMEIVS